jgi:hypothetical protein
LISAAYSWMEKFYNNKDPTNVAQKMEKKNIISKIN